MPVLWMPSSAGKAEKYQRHWRMGCSVMEVSDDALIVEVQGWWGLLPVVVFPWDWVAIPVRLHDNRQARWDMRGW